MKKIIPGHFFLIICLTVFSLTANAQNKQDSIKSQIETIDGNEYIGVIVEQTPTAIRIKTDKLGEISIPTAEIKKNFSTFFNQIERRNLLARQSSIDTLFLGPQRI